VGQQGSKTREEALQLTEEACQSEADHGAFNGDLESCGGPRWFKANQGDTTKDKESDASHRNFVVHGHDGMFQFVQQHAHKRQDGRRRAHNPIVGHRPVLEFSGVLANGQRGVVGAVLGGWVSGYWGYNAAPGRHSEGIVGKPGTRVQRIFAVDTSSARVSRFEP